MMSDLLKSYITPPPPVPGVFSEVVPFLLCVCAAVTADLVIPQPLPSLPRTLD